MTNTRSKKKKVNLEAECARSDLTRMVESVLDGVSGEEALEVMKELAQGGRTLVLEFTSKVSNGKISTTGESIKLLR